VTWYESETRIYGDDEMRGGAGRTVANIHAEDPAVLAAALRALADSLNPAGAARPLTTWPETTDAEPDLFDEVQALRGRARELDDALDRTIEMNATLSRELAETEGALVASQAALLAERAGKGAQPSAERRNPTPEGPSDPPGDSEGSETLSEGVSDPLRLAGRLGELLDAARTWAEAMREAYGPDLAHAAGGSQRLIQAVDALAHQPVVGTDPEGDTVKTLEAMVPPDRRPPDRAEVRDIGALTERLIRYCSDTQDAESVLSTALRGVLVDVDEERRIALDIDARNVAPATNEVRALRAHWLNRGYHTGKIEMANRVVRAVERGLVGLRGPAPAGELCGYVLKTRDGALRCDLVGDEHEDDGDGMIRHAADTVGATHYDWGRKPKLPAALDSERCPAKNPETGGQTRCRYAVGHDERSRQHEDRYGYTWTSAAE